MDCRELKNKPRTVTSKKYHFKDFVTRALKNEDVEINSFNKASIANYKKALLKVGQTGKTIDNKLLTLMDFFDYAMNQGFYTVDNSNPVSGLFVLTKRERVSKTKSYEPFAPKEISTLFEPLAYKQAMKAPDLFFWGGGIAGRHPEFSPADHNSIQPVYGKWPGSIECSK